MVSLFASGVGQGDEDLLNEETLSIVSDNIRIQIAGLVNAIGTGEFLKLFGRESIDAQAAAEIASTLAKTIAAMLDQNGGAEPLMLLLDTSDGEILEMLPADFNENGEVE